MQTRATRVEKLFNLHFIIICIKNISKCIQCEEYNHANTTNTWCMNMNGKLCNLNFSTCINNEIKKREVHEILAYSWKLTFHLLSKILDEKYTKESFLHFNSIVYFPIMWYLWKKTINSKIWKQSTKENVLHSNVWMDLLYGPLWFIQLSCYYGVKMKKVMVSSTGLGCVQRFAFLSVVLKLCQQIEKSLAVMLWQQHSKIKNKFEIVKET